MFCGEEGTQRLEGGSAGFAICQRRGSVTATARRADADGEDIPKTLTT